jgi:hypothetical protein
MFDESDHMITESTEIEQKGALRLNGSVENCSSELIRMKKGAVILNGAESFDSRRNKVGFLSGFEAPFGVMDASSSMSHNTRLGKPPNLASSSDSTQFPQSFDTSDKLQLVSLQKTSDVLHVTDQSSPSSSPTDSALLCDQEDVAHSDPNRTSQFLSTVPTHTRSLSQTTSQLTSLIEKSESGNVGDTSHVNNLFEGSCVQVLSDKWGATHLKNAADTPNLYKPQVSPCDMCDVRTVQEPTTSVGHSTEPDISDVKEESDFKSSHEQPQCCGEVLQSFPLEPEAKVSSVRHSPCPDWKLDRRASGHLFWRRDSSTLNGIDPSSRVKFRYDIEVREFESRNSEAEDLADDDYDNVYDDYDDDDDYDYDDEVQGVNRRRVSNFRGLAGMKEESSSFGTSAFICVVAITAIVVMASYRWLLSALSLT